MSLAPHWLQAVSALNPLTFAVDAQRALFADHIADRRVAEGFLVIGVLAVVAVGAARRAFNRTIA
jgi:ABC-2 type transport system permease protein